MGRESRPLGWPTWGRRLLPCPEPHAEQDLVFPFGEGTGLLGARLKCAGAWPPWTFIHSLNKVIHSASVCRTPTVCQVRARHRSTSVCLDARRGARPSPRTVLSSQRPKEEEKELCACGGGVEEGRGLRVWRRPTRVWADGAWGSPRPVDTTPGMVGALEGSEVGNGTTDALLQTAERFLSLVFLLSLRGRPRRSSSQENRSVARPRGRTPLAWQPKKPPHTTWATLGDALSLEQKSDPKRTPHGPICAEFWNRPSQACDRAALAYAGQGHEGSP